ncbi:MAG: hypothetical protein AVDCRST_MAG11-2856, partial [uncultured Gemmatimonadaceae bacterium]
VDIHPPDHRRRALRRGVHARGARRRRTLQAPRLAPGALPVRPAARARPHVGTGVGDRARRDRRGRVGAAGRGRRRGHRHPPALAHRAAPGHVRAVRLEPQPPLQRQLPHLDGVRDRLRRLLVPPHRRAALRRGVHADRALRGGGARVDLRRGVPRVQGAHPALAPAAARRARPRPALLRRGVAQRGEHLPAVRRARGRLRGEGPAAV